MRLFPPQSPPAFDKRNKRRSRGVLGKGTKWKMDATSLHDDVLFDPRECYKSETDRAFADVDTLEMEEANEQFGKL